MTTVTDEFKPKVKPPKKVRLYARVSPALKAEIVYRAAKEEMAITDYVESVLSKKLGRN